MTTDYFAHETAIVEDGASIGAGTSVWHHAHVRSSAVIGRNCTLGKNVFVDRGVVLGDRVKVQNNVSLYNGVVLHDDVFVGPSVVFTNDRFPRANNLGWTILSTVVSLGASIGANATIVCGCVVGPYAMVGAGAVVTRDIPRHALVTGNPARRIGTVCVCGQRFLEPNDRTGKCGGCGRPHPDVAR